METEIVAIVEVLISISATLRLLTIGVGLIAMALWVRNIFGK